MAPGQTKHELPRLFALAGILQAIRQCLTERGLALWIYASELTMDAIVASLSLRGWRATSVARIYVLAHLFGRHPLRISRHARR